MQRPTSAQIAEQIGQKPKGRNQDARLKHSFAQTAEVLNPKKD